MNGHLISMVAKEKHRGHEMYFDESVKHWRYLDDDSFVKDVERPCGVCSKSRTPEGHDACLGTLTGVLNACCGHGDVDAAYVVFHDGTRLSGVEASFYFQSVMS